MAKRRTTPDRPRDLNQLAHRIVAIATGEAPDDAPLPPAPVAAKRGAARAAKLTPDERRGIARKAARARWSKEG